MSNSLSDVFSDTPPASPSSTTPYSAEPSDIPRLRSIHVTNGYREGIASSKEQALQPGFDEVYPLGAILGLRVGYILGVLEGLCSAYQSAKPAPIGAGGEEDTGVETKESEGKKAGELLVRAKEEFKLEMLFGKGYWNNDGMWAYKVRRKEEDVTFWEVADQHPVVKKWSATVRDEVQKAGVQNAEEGFLGIGVEGGVGRDSDIEEREASSLAIVRPPKQPRA
ncbi:MAG: hypothetical protein Q9225_004716 [Loekoesia sp. 1 TL-2023]